MAEFSKQNSRRRPASNCTIRRQLRVDQSTPDSVLGVGAVWGNRGRQMDRPGNELTWEKWGPSDPTSPHWYDVPRLARLIGANIARAQDHHEPVKTVRDFVA
jgi:hypothetical protein